MKTITILIAVAGVGLTVATVATAQLPPIDRWLQLDVPAGNVEVRPPPPNWQPRPVWAPDGVAPAGYIPPMVLMQLEENRQNPHFAGALMPDAKPPMWMGIGLPKR
jgi:hypothetical protein